MWLGGPRPSLLRSFQDAQSDPALAGAAFLLAAAQSKFPGSVCYSSGMDLCTPPSKSLRPASLILNAIAHDAA
jgi:hypothetical protein